jgi:DNA-directed RNA polymerase subunit RPC12/RpoP
MEVDVMNVKPMIKCNCGQRVVAKDVMQTGYYLRLFEPSFVYVKFRCSRCKKLGEQFVKQDEWEDGILKDLPSEVNADEQHRFRAMGSIDVHEAIGFHFALDEGKALSKLAEFMEFDRSSGAEADTEAK